MIVSTHLKRIYKELSPEAKNEIQTYVNTTIARLWLIENNLTANDLLKEQKRRLKAKKRREYE